MASNLPSNILSSKSSNSISQVSSPSLSQVGPPSSGESQRRSGGSGSFGVGATTRSGPSPRNKQTPRNQTKQSRRYRIADEDAFAESAAMKNINSRKGQTSITHLMNFSLPPRPSHFNQYLNSSHRGLRRNPTWGLGSGHHATDKARYVHANYRFIVDPQRDYQAQSVDADVYLDWNNVQQILASPQSQASACPICLGEPVAPRMAKCGHIFCLPCLIRYMHSTDDTEQFPEKRARWKKCPICWDSIYISETRPVRWYIGQEGPAPREGEDIVLRLVIRPAGSTLALPREGYPAAKDEEIPWHFAADVMDYARVMKGTEDYMIAQYDNEVGELEQLEKHDELMFGEDSEWTGRAIKAVNEAKEKVRGLGNGPSMLQKPEEPKLRRKVTSTIGYSAAPGLSIAQQADRGLEASSNANVPNPFVLAQFAGNATSPGTSALSTSLAHFRSLHGTSTAPSDYYFYQALLHYYLSPLDIRILKVAFGDFSSFPSTILPCVERISTGHIVDDEMRKRAKYLAHLPQGCEVSFLECDWTDTVSADVLENFKPEIERRRKKNSDKEAREEKERVRAEKEEDDKRYAATRRKRPSSPIIERFQPADFQPLLQGEVARSDGSFDGTLESTSPMWGTGKQNGSVFASLGSPSSSPNTTRTVWGTTAIVPASPTLPAMTMIQQEHPSADDGWLQGWESDLMHEEDIVAQVQAMSMAGESSRAGGAAPAKKKRGKKITLMSTNARRGA